MDGNRVFTAARIVALAIIGVLVAGLAYLRFAPTEEIVVPDGAKAGVLALEPCTYETEAGPMPADCGTLVVPETRMEPDSRLIALPVVRIHARSDDPAEPIFALWGGPGQTNMEWPMASRYAGDNDVVLVGYRGVDGSVRLDCPEVESAIGHSTDILSEESFQAYAAGLRACAARLRADGVDPSAYGLTQQVEDLEAARVALGYDRIDLLSESAGTRTAMIYAWRYPESIHRSVMVGVNPPGNFVWDPQTTDEQIDRYADHCAADSSCSTRTDDLAASMRRIGADMPERWFFLPIDEGNVRILSFTAMMSSTSEAGPDSAQATFDAWLSATEGDASGLWITSVLADVMAPELFVWGQYAAAAMADAQAAREYFSSGGREHDWNLGYAGTAFVWGGGRLDDAWPAAPDEGAYSRVRPSDVETLLIGGELDVSTPPQVATKELLPYLPNGHEVVLPGFYHSTGFWSDQPEAGTRLITTFFDTGRVDDSLYEPQGIDFTPPVMLTTLGKWVAGTLGGLALITAVSLLWMARRVHKRGRIGPKASATLRSVFPIVLGLGGWALGVLIVMTTLPGVPLDEEVLVALSAGLPIGLGVYLAWTHRDRMPSAKATGSVAATASALVGAWLGFNATEGVAALVTAIVGATIGANLLLILFDIAEGQSERLTPAGRVDRMPERIRV